jgi:GntR family transcriptional regulator
MVRKSERPLALYHRIYMVLREKLLDGTFKEGEALPSETTLAEMYGVSRVTIRMTLKNLQDDGLISREHGRGTFPRVLAEPGPAMLDLQGFMNNLTQFGQRTTGHVLSFDYVVPPPTIALIFNLPAEKIVQRAMRVLSHRLGVFAFVTTYVREEIGRTFTRADLECGPLLPLLLRAGVCVGRADQTVTAKSADAKVSELLGIALGSALLSLRRTIYDTGGQAVEVNQGLYRPDRYEFQLTLSPPHSGKRASVR